MGTSKRFTDTSWHSELTVDHLRLIQMQKEQPQTTPVVQPNGSAKSSKQKPPKPQPSQQQQPQIVQAQPQQQPAQAQQPPQQKPRSRSRSRNNKREDGTSSRRQSGSNASGAAAPTMILQRSPKGKSPPPGLALEVNGSTVPISKADGIAAGEAILGMISQPQVEPQQEKKQRKQQQTAELLVPTAVQPQSISKEQLKQTLISLLDDTQFFDQIYHAYVDRVLKRAA